MDIDALCREMASHLVGGLAHCCQCRLCTGEAFPAVPAYGAPYAATVGPAWARTFQGIDARQCFIVLDGQDMRDQPSVKIVEACEGEYGWVVIVFRGADQQTHECVCGSDLPCAYAVYGAVTIVPRPPR